MAVIFVNAAVYADIQKLLILGKIVRNASLVKLIYYRMWNDDFQVGYAL